MRTSPRVERRIFRSLLVTSISFLPAICPAWLHGQVVSTSSLPRMLDAATAAFTAGAFAEAADAFAAAENEFGEEESWKRADPGRRIWPIRAYAQLRAGRPADAVATLERFYDHYGRNTEPRRFTAFVHASALRDAGRLEEAIDAFGHCADAAPSSSTALLAARERAELFFRLNRIHDGLGALDKIATVAPESSFAARVRLRALQLALEHERIDDALQRLTASDWRVDRMPELATLAFAALNLGDRLMESGRPEDALRAFRLVPSRNRLLERQKARLVELEREIRRERTGPGLTDRAWNDHQLNLLGGLRRQWEALHKAEDYTPGLDLRRGQTFLLAGRPREAWLTLERLTLDEGTPAVIRAEAHYRWILAALAIEAWEEALGIARAFSRQHPDSKLGPDVLFLIARTHIGRRRWDDAEQVLTGLLADHPAHSSAHRWLFQRGQVRLLAGRQTPAREDFTRYREDHPDGPLAAQAEYWRAVSLHLEGRHHEAAAALSVLAESVGPHPFAGEIAYRRAAILYAAGETGDATSLARTFLRNYPGHLREGEALVLLGDLLMGSGDLPGALDAFARVPDQPERLWTYAVFQTGKIFQAKGDLDEMERHFKKFLAEARPDQSRLAEGVYRVGWIHQRRGDPEGARLVYLQALDRFGNDPDAVEIPLLLSALTKIPDPSGEPFDNWLEASRARSRTDQRWTLYARLSWFLAERHTAKRLPHLAEKIRLETLRDTPREALDAEGLNRAARTLADIGSVDAADWAREALDRFPESPARGGAYLVLARDELAMGREHAALALLERIERETPGHPAAMEARLAIADAHRRLGDLAEAAARFDTVLKDKRGRGRIHAMALNGLATVYKNLEQFPEAIGCYQRIYTAYRGYPDLLGEAYWESARLFEQLGDLEAARRTHEEFMASESLAFHPQRSQVLAALSRLREKPANGDSSVDERTTP